MNKEIKYVSYSNQSLIHWKASNVLGNLFIFLQNLFFLDKGNNILHYCETQIVLHEVLHVKHYNFNHIFSSKCWTKYRNFSMFVILLFTLPSAVNVSKQKSLK